MSETRALLVIDVVDSTAIAGHIGDAAMSRLWRAHDRGARDLLATWHGREIDRSDGFFLLFDSAGDAVGYALDYHCMLSTLPGPDDVSMTARAGVHVGPLTMRSNPPEDVARGAKPLEADGVAKAVAARVMSVARGGQTLLTGAARDALGATSVRTRSHGHWRLKGLREPIELFEAAGAAATFEPPADGEKVFRVVSRSGHWLPVREIGHSLPAEPDAFIGREDALGALAGLVDDGARLITVHGMGGCGKTRLALHYGWHWLGDFATGAWFCDLSAARDIEGVVRAVSQGLQVPLGRTDAVTQLGQAIAGRGPCLVIVDNVEQVAQVAEATVGAWLARAAQARFLITSRDVLRIPGERVLELRPLNRDEGVALFRLRATAAGAPDPGDGAEVRTLIDMLDGLPLAIELAAARSPLMPPSELNERMGERFMLLAGARGRPNRQATLRATLDWSWELLSLAERDALAQLSVFDGGATLAAIEATVERGTHDDVPQLMDVLQSLVEKSFARRLAPGRLDMPSSVREYAAERLATPGAFPGSGAEALAQAQARHWAWFAKQPAESAVRDGCADLGNWVAATRRAAAAGDTASACATLEGSWAALRLRGPFALGLELAECVAHLTSPDARQRSRIDRVAGWALRNSGRVAEARQRLDAALAAAQQAGDLHEEAQVRALLGDLLVNEGRTEMARDELSRALAIAAGEQDRLLACQVETGFGHLEDYLGNLDAAAERYAEALEQARACGHRRWEGGALGNLGLVRDQQGRSDEARRLYQAALAVARELGDRQWEGNNLCNLGLLLHLSGDQVAARQALDAALAAARQLGHARLECITSINSALVAGALGDNDASERLFDSALRIAVELNDQRTEGLVRGNLGALYARLGRLDAARDSIERGAALLAQVSDRLGQGLLLCDRAEYLHWSGDGPAARESAAEARALAGEIRAGLTSELGHRVAMIERLLG